MDTTQALLIKYIIRSKKLPFFYTSPVVGRGCGPAYASGFEAGFRCWPNTNPGYTASRYIRAFGIGYQDGITAFRDEFANWGAMPVEGR